MAVLLRRGAPLLCGLGVVIFIVALAVGGHIVYGVSLLTFAAGLIGIALRPVETQSRGGMLFYSGLAIAAAASVVDGSLDLANHVGAVTSSLTVVILVGLAIALLGRVMIVGATRGGAS